MQRQHDIWLTRAPSSRATLLVVTFVVLAGCWLGREVRKIHDVTVAETVVLQAATDTPSRLDLYIRGRIEGQATLTLLLEGEPYKTATLQGEVDVEWSGDWYHPQAVVEYKPEGVRGGSLELKFHF